MSLIEIKDVHKTFDNFDVLKGINLNIEKGQVVTIIGSSGSGKSTLLNVAGGLDVSTSGEILIKGRSSATFKGSDFDSYRNTFVGFVFQEYNILN